MNVRTATRFECVDVQAAAQADDAIDTAGVLKKLTAWLAVFGGVSLVAALVYFAPLSTHDTIEPRALIGIVAR